MRSLAPVSPARTPDRTETLLRELVDVNRQILHELQQQAKTTHGSHLREDEAQFLSAIVTAVQSRAFSAAELLAHGIVDADLRQALGNLTSRQIGKRLRALADRDVGGFTVQRVSRDGSGTIWTVHVSAHLHT